MKKSLRWRKKGTVLTDRKMGGPRRKKDAHRRRTNLILMCKGSAGRTRNSFNIDPLGEGRALIIKERAAKTHNAMPSHEGEKGEGEVRCAGSGDFQRKADEKSPRAHGTPCLERVDTGKEFAKDQRDSRLERSRRKDILQEERRYKGGPNLIERI